jgi:RNA polymerase sigma factor (sigma-70 family)
VALGRWKSRVSDVCLEELQQVGLTRLYLEAEKWSGHGNWVQYVVPRIHWAMLDWLRIEGTFPRGKRGKRARVAQGRHVTWRDHPEMPDYVPRALVTLRLGHFVVKRNWSQDDPSEERVGTLLDDLIPSEQPTPEEEFNAQEDLRMLDKLIDGLESEMARRVLRLRLDGHPLRTVAQTVGLSASRVQQIYNEAVKAMRRAAKRQGFERNG